MYLFTQICDTELERVIRLFSSFFFFLKCYHRNAGLRVSNGGLDQKYTVGLIWLLRSVICILYVSCLLRCVYRKYNFVNNISYMCEQGNIVKVKELPCIMCLLKSCFSTLLYWKLRAFSFFYFFLYITKTSNDCFIQT